MYDPLAVVLAQLVVEFALGAYHTFKRAETFKVSLSHVGYYAVVRLDDVDQSLDFARMVGSHLYHGNIVFGREAQQRLRHAEVVVEVALSVEHVIFFGQYGCHEFLCRGLAVGAGYSNDFSS